MALNPNYPLVETAWGPYWTCNGGEIPPDRYVDIGGRTLGQFTAGRGRQYELDQVQAGTTSIPLSNTDGALDQTNAAGPWAGHILPFQPIRRRAQWPPTINLLNQAQATGGDVGGQPLGVLSTADNGPRILSETDTTGGAFVASGTAWQGVTVAAFAVLTGATSGKWVCYTSQPAVRPGATYTVQLRVRNITPSTSVKVAAGFRTKTVTDASATTAAGSTVTLVGSATAAWTQITVTATAAATSSGMWVGVQVVAPGTATATVQVDSWQLEASGAATTWVQPGVWYSIAAQFTEDWPAQWTNGGTYGTVTPTGVDAFALLSQRTLSDAVSEELQSKNLRFLYRFDDAADSTSANDATGTYPAAPVKHGKYGPGAVTFGTELTATDPVNGVPLGSPATVAHFENSGAGTDVVTAASYISLDAVGISGPANLASASWTRILAFRYTGPGRASRTDDVIMWSAMDTARPVIQNKLLWTITPVGLFQVKTRGTSGGDITVNVATVPNVDDGNWHLAAVSYDAANDTLWTWVDDYYHSFGSFKANGWLPLTLTGDSVGNYVDEATGGGTSFNFAGDLAFCAEYPTVMSTNDAGRLWLAWKSALGGDSTDDRYKKMLRYAGYTGPVSISTGQTTSMGPSTDLAGQDVLSALQAIVDTEGGAHYVDGAGVITFTSRGDRYNALTPMFTFGENTAGGEFPYDDCQPDFDSTHLGNIAQVTQSSTGTVFTATDDASMAAYFPRTLTRTVNSGVALECQDAASYIVSRYRQPATRVSTLRLHPSAYPALWPVCLSLEQGTRIRVMRRPLGAPAIQLDQFVESLNWTMDDGGDAVLVLQTSPADLSPYAIFAAWHTTLRTTIASGVSTITVNASADTTNPLATQLGPGQQLILGQNTANQETVTVKAVGATSAGWTSAVLTLTAATTKAHTAGDLITEPLPAGVTDPTTYDASSMFDSTVFAY